MSTPTVYFNGVNGATGRYASPPLNLADLSAIIRGETPSPAHASRFETSARNLAKASFGLPFGTDPSDPLQGGWAVVFHVEESDAVRQALADLIALRRRQIGERLVKVLDYRPGEPWLAWLERHGATPGDVDPENAVPYYVLVVGSPERIPLEFHYLMDIDYAVGRIAFDTPDEYARYAATVVAHETAQTVAVRKTAAFFGTRHDVFPPDAATQQSCDQLARPLAGQDADGKPAGTAIAARLGFEQRCFFADAATKANLTNALCAPPDGRPPALLFTASHGMEFPPGDPRQLDAQGALLCQDWPGPGASDPAFYFTAADVPDDATVRGMITFHFACYGAGTPQADDFPRSPGGTPPQIAPRPFLAKLPRRLLAHPRGGALAVIGHVERAWTTSIAGLATTGSGNHIQPFVNTVGFVLSGKPVGFAVKDFASRAASLSTLVSQMLEDVRYGQQISDADLALAWLGRNDARNYVTLGDPAVRLRPELMT